MQSWRNSLRATAQVFDEAGLKDHGVILEYQLPQTSKRLDCMICGKNDQEADNTVVIELKQREGAREAVGEKLVTTWVGGGKREVLHPAAHFDKPILSQLKGRTRLFSWSPRYAFLPELRTLLRKALESLPAAERRKHFTQRRRPRRTAKPS